MADMISCLPDEVLCDILSLLSTKEVVATSVLSKQWEPLWRSVPTLDLEEYSYRKLNYFHLDKPLKRFRHYFRSSLCNPADVEAWLAGAVNRGVEHLDLSLFAYITWIIGLPSALLECKTLVVLQMTGLNLKIGSSVRLPSLRMLHLHCVKFLEPMHFAELLSGCPNLEDLNAMSVNCIYDEHVYEFLHEIEDDDMEGIQAEFKTLPKLVRARIHESDATLPLEVVNNVVFLSVDWLRYVNLQYHMPEFHNLTHIEFGYLDLERASERLQLLKVLEHSPKLQILVIDKKSLGLRAYERADWSYPQSVPTCVSLHLKACRLTNYVGLKCEFQFARYIMQNASHLQTMTICTNTSSNEGKKLEMIENLSSCTRCSATCKLSFK